MVIILFFVVFLSRVIVSVLFCFILDLVLDLSLIELGLVGGSEFWCFRVFLGVLVLFMLFCDSDLLGVFVFLGGVVSFDRGVFLFFEFDCIG